MLTPLTFANETRSATWQNSFAADLANGKTRELFAALRLRAKANDLVALMFPTRKLEDLHDYVARRPVASQHYGGLRRVAISAIVGSESKSHDFDRSFNPRHDYQEQRWLRVAEAYQADRLPPVELVEIEGRYFVRDGHHRVSVARALGAVDIDAEVVVWVPAAECKARLDLCPAAV
jgi:hypothetical protein